MQFEWDPEKEADNLRKHGVSFEFATKAFNDGLALEDLDDREDYGEERNVRIAQADGILLTVVYTDREEKKRLISARRATKDEQDQYYRENAS
jgi:uncharacterized DUF497 family protein